MPYHPQRILIEGPALDLPLTRRVLARAPDAPVEIIGRSGRVPNPPRGPAGLVCAEAKRILIVALRPHQPLRTCRPSADYELPLGSSCPGMCQYCYLQSSLGARPYVRVYADLDGIMAAVDERVSSVPDEGEISFEAASTSDPMAVEHLTGALAEIIPFFGRRPKAALRLVTKFAVTEGLAGLTHARRTRIRYSLNTPFIVRQFEAGTDPIDDRISAANLLGRADYPIGFVLAPLMIYDGWQAEYEDLLSGLADKLDAALHDGLTFELISHRFTARAKEIIMDRFPRSRLDMDECRRHVKFGRYGRQKFVYRRDEMHHLWNLVQNAIEKHFPKARVEYHT